MEEVFTICASNDYLHRRLMGKRAIQIIILLMSISLIGLAVLQSYWIRQSVRDLEQRFDNDVYDVLKKSTEYLERQEDKRRKRAKRNLGNRANSLLITEQEEEMGGFFEASDYLKTSLEEKIDHLALYEFIEKEIESLNITAKYHYGIYDLKSEMYVIIDDHYSAPQSSGKSSPAFERGLHYGKFDQYKTYSRDFFGTVRKPEAQIQMYFPQRAQFIWKSALPFLILVFTFLLLILGCFIYTISVILRQKKVSEMKTDFINNMTHEFKTPIATISLATDSINSEKVISDPDRVRRFTGIIKQENTRMLSQVEKVLQMALIDKRNFELKIQKVDLVEIIEKAVEHTRLKVLKRGGSIELDLKAQNHIIEGDETHIGNMIYNLLDNAEKYSPDAPVIKVRSEDRRNAVAITIEDEGVGLSSEAKKYIFDKFYRVHTGNLHDVKGFGLGLTYVKNLITAHQGEIEVKSELNKGSQFTLVFPLKQNVH